MRNKSIVVVGASRGIGKEIVNQLAENSEYTIYALSRDLAKMQENFSSMENVHCFAFDLVKNGLLTNFPALFMRISIESIFPKIVSACL